MATPEEQRRRRIQYGSLAAFLAVGVVIALIAISQAGDDDGGGDAGGIEGAAEVEAEFEGIPQEGTVLGDPEAPITVGEFADPQCPACAEFSGRVVPELVSRQVRPGTVKLDFGPWVILGEDSRTAAKAVLAAGEQDRLWQFLTLFYENQGVEGSGYVTEDFLESLAEGAEIPDLEQWREDRDDPRWDELISETDTQATSLGFTGTPSLLVLGPRGQQPLEGFGLAEIEAAIDRASG